MRLPRRLALAVLVSLMLASASRAITAETREARRSRTARRSGRRPIPGVRRVLWRQQDGQDKAYTATLCIALGDPTLGAHG